MGTLNDVSVKAAVSRGHPQGGVLSQLVWCPVIDDLIARLNMGRIYCQGYADDICLMAVGKFPNTVRSSCRGLFTL
jgi:hypothetical protein